MILYMKPTYTQTGCLIFGLVLGVVLGYQNGLVKANLDWKKLLVDKELAEYNRKTGIWQFRDLSDIQMQSTLGLTTPNPPTK